MKHLSEIDAADLERWAGGVVEATRDAVTFEEMAQVLTGRLYDQFTPSIVLTRCYVTAPLASLPESNTEWVRKLAEAKGIADELRDTTPVISLVGTAGRHPDWNSRRASKGHVGIPMVSASFIDAIPMMSRLMASLGGDLSWIDSDDISHVVSQLGTVAGVFHVADAATETDTRGRRIVPAADFVSEYGVKTVFGVGGAFSSGQIVVLLAFCSEHVSLEIARMFQQPLMQFKSAAAPVLRRVFVDGTATRPAERGPAATRPRGPRGDVHAGGSGGNLVELLAARDRELEALNAMYLKLESELEDRTRSLKIILDSTNDGLILLDLDGTIYGETTAIVEGWFGARPAGVQAGDYLFGAGSREAGYFGFGFQQITEDMLPFEVAVDQMPRRLQRGDRIYSLEYQPVRQDQWLVRVLLVVRDITEREAAAQAEGRARELHLIMASALRDRRGFARFLDDTQALLARIVGAGDRVEQQRDLHTVKGNTAVYGFQSFSELVHRLESEGAAGPDLLRAERRKQLADAWNQEVSLLADMVDVRFGSTIEISGREYEEFVTRLGDLPGAGPLLETARRWRFDSIGQVMVRLAAQAERIAARLGKQVEVTVEDHGLRLPLEHTQAFWSSLVHVVRNAVDHGIEAHDHRRALGKPPRGNIALDARLADNELVVTVSDDGAGVDWDAVRARLAAANIQVADQTALTDALFADGFTTRSEVNYTSGRGVGLSAVRAACHSIGGRIDLSSSPGKGTIVRVSVPLGALTAPA